MAAEHCSTGIGVSDILITDFIKALYLDAGQETDPERRAQLEADARQAEDVWRRSKYALAPTRDQFTASIGNAALNIADRMEELLNISKDTHVQMQDLHLQIPQIISTLAEVSARQGKLETGQAELATAVSNLREEVDDLNERDTAQYQESRIHRTQLDARLGRIEELLSPYLTDEARAQQEADRTLFERMKQRFLADEAGDGPAE